MRLLQRLPNSSFNSVSFADNANTPVHQAVAHLQMSKGEWIYPAAQDEVVIVEARST